MFDDISKVIILSDMDGTLLDTKKRISDRNIAAIAKFTELGGKFTIATGRTVQTFEQFTKILELKMPVILYNGAAIHDYVSSETLYTHPLPSEAKTVTTQIYELMPDIGGEVLKTDGTYVFSNTEYQQLHTKLCGITPNYSELAEIPEGDWLKVLFALAPEDIPFLEILVRQHGFDKTLDFVRSSDIFFEMLPKGVSKGSALEEYRKLDGMDEFTFVSIGDFDNDIEMIRAADFGVCPANAEESVKNSADLVLSHTNDESALAELVEYIIDKCGKSR